jgi:hypothetical protein
MDGAFLSALAALGGSVVGGLASGTATWLSQRSQLQAGTRARQISHREDLFRDFIVAATKAYGLAMMTDKPELQDFVSIFGMIARMEVICSQRTIGSARRVARETLETYFQPNKTFEDLLTMMRDGVGLRPFSDFAEAAREELQQLGSH